MLLTLCCVFICVYMFVCVLECVHVCACVHAYLLVHQRQVVLEFSVAGYQYSFTFLVILWSTSTTKHL